MRGKFHCFSLYVVQIHISSSKLSMIGRATTVVRRKNLLVKSEKISSFLIFFVCLSAQKRSKKMFSLSTSLVPVARPTTTTSLRSSNTKVRFVLRVLLTFFVSLSLSLSFLLSFLLRVCRRPARVTSSLIKTSSSSSNFVMYTYVYARDSVAFFIRQKPQK